MKIRIQDNSIRFRITVRELETLSTQGSLWSFTTFPNEADEPSQVFGYGIEIGTAEAETRIQFHDGKVIITLSPADLTLLQDDRREGVYFKREPDAERVERFMFFVEKDRPAATCDKPEHWIYDEVAGKPAGFRPINKGSN